MPASVLSCFHYLSKDCDVQHVVRLIDSASHVIKRIFNPRFSSLTAFYDVAGTIHQFLYQHHAQELMDSAHHVIRRIFSSGFLSLMSFYDVAGIIHQSLIFGPRAAHSGVEQRARLAGVPPERQGLTLVHFSAQRKYLLWATIGASVCGDTSSMGHNSSQTGHKTAH
jgi:hypothetical protein